MAPRTDRIHSLVDLFFFNDTPTTEIYTLSLHDALPISINEGTIERVEPRRGVLTRIPGPGRLRLTRRLSFLVRSCLLTGDRKSTRLNSSHVEISYAVFCLKKKKNTKNATSTRINQTHTH